MYRLIIPIRWTFWNMNTSKNQDKGREDWIRGLNWVLFYQYKLTTFSRRASSIVTISSSTSSKTSFATSSIATKSSAVCVSEPSTAIAWTSKSTISESWIGKIVCATSLWCRVESRRYKILHYILLFKNDMMYKMNMTWINRKLIIIQKRCPYKLGLLYYQIVYRTNHCVSKDCDYDLRILAVH